MPSAYLHELMRSEVETPQQGGLIEDLAKHGISLPQLIALFEEKTLTPVYAHIDSLEKLPPKELSDDFMKAKRALLDSLSWMSLCEQTYRTHQPESLDPESLAYFEQMVEKLHGQMAKIDRFTPQVLLARKKDLPSDYHKTAQIALDSIEKILRAEINSNAKEIPSEKAEEHAKVVQVLEIFLSQQAQIFHEIAEDANAKQSSWEQDVVSTGRGIYIKASERCPFPLIYSVKGNLYVIMEVASHYISKGTMKFVTRTANLKTGQIDALVKPMEFFPDKETPEEKAQFKKAAFWDTWRDADMLLQFPNQQGILQVRDRLVFQFEDKKVLYLIEEYCQGKTLHRLLNRMQEGLYKLTFSEKLSLAHDILLGLKQFHDAQLIHHDIKPDNILLNKTSEGKLSAVLSDFNISCYTHDRLLKDIARVVPNWCAPEYAHVLKDPNCPMDSIYAAATQKMDVWAVGIILFILFNEKLPAWHLLEEKDQVLDAVCSLQPGWLPRYPGDEYYYPLLEKMLEVDPAKRCSSAEAFDVLQQIVQQEKDVRDC
ncbi:MAG: protein kinase [Parachlamydiales bacterium]